MIMGLIILFLVSRFNFLFVRCGRLSCSYPSAFYRTLNTHYRIVIFGVDECDDAYLLMNKTVCKKIAIGSSQLGNDWPIVPVG